MKEESQPLIEIQDSEINVREIMAEIEESLKRRNIDFRDIERISKLSLSPETPSGHGRFDPSGTAHLFEKGISPPGFTNPIFRYLKGPFRWFFVKFIEAYSLFDKKISENRIRAFFSVVYELVLLRKRYERLERKMGDLILEVSKLKTGSRQNELMDQFDPLVPLEAIPDPGQKRILEMLVEGEKTLLLFPFRDTFMQSLNLKKIPFRAIVYKRNLYDYLRSQVSSEIDLVEDFSSFSDFRGYKNIVFVGNACILPAHLLEKLFFSISRNSDSGTKIFFRFANSSITFHNPFQENYLTRISVDLLTHFLREEGFKNIVRHTVEEGELSLFTFQKP